MTIDRIEPLPLQEHVFKLHLSDGTVIKTQDYVIADLGLYPGAALDEEKLRELRAAAGLASAKNRAVRIVAATGVSKQELERRLTQKGESEQDAKAAVHWLSELELLDDAKVQKDKRDADHDQTLDVHHGKAGFQPNGLDNIKNYRHTGTS